MKVSEMLQQYEMVGLTGVETEVVRNLVLKAYTCCYRKGAVRKQALNTHFGAKASTNSSLKIPTTKTYWDGKIMATYQNNTIVGENLIRIQVKLADGGLMVLNSTVDCRSKTLKILTYNAQNDWQEHLLSL